MFKRRRITHSVCDGFAGVYTYINPFPIIPKKICIYILKSERLQKYNKSNNKQQHTTSKITKEAKQKSRLGAARNKIMGGGFN